jgi:predicted flap endonuclease-1-like 5' DNA nuclease
LRDSDEARLREAIERGGVKFAPSATTWSKQAEFLAAGDEQGFDEYVSFLVAGRLPSSDDRRADRPSDILIDLTDDDDSAPADDLERIEGIGPVMRVALNNQGITRFSQLARLSDEELHAILEGEGQHFVPSMGTWSKQAVYLAYADDEGFAAYTQYLVGGRDPGTYRGAAPVDRRLGSHRMSTGGSRRRGSGGDDIERIEGIGPKIGGALRAAGLDTFESIATADEDRLRSVVTDAGIGFTPSLKTWSAQARMLADGDEQGFATYTALLIAGREPQRDGAR